MAGCGLERVELGWVGTGRDGTGWDGLGWVGLGRGVGCPERAQPP